MGATTLDGKELVDSLTKSQASRYFELDAVPKFTLKDLERVMILGTLAANDGNRERTAKQLGIGLRTLQRRLKQYEEGKKQQ